jgi:hypothetical protein
MRQNCSGHRFVATGLLLLLLLAGCGSTGSNPTTIPKTPMVSEPVETGGPFPTYIGTVSNEMSTVSFTLHGGVTGVYTIRASQPTSKLRHGYREFTIDVAEASMSIYLAFFGYHGPGSYTLAEAINGGDVRISFYRTVASWDLSLWPKAQCSLTITSETSTPYTGLDKIRGTFSCPLLPSSSPTHPQQPVTVSDGHIDVAIIAES